MRSFSGRDAALMNASEQVAAKLLLKSDREQAVSMGRLLANVLQPIIPTGWCGKVTIVVDNGTITSRNINVEYR